MLINPVLLKLEKEVALQTVLDAAETDQLFACDFGIIGAKHFVEKPWGYERDRVVNIDHHALTAVMRRQISSTNLALRYVSQNGIAQRGDTILINHTDCDSILSAAIMCGHLKSSPELGETAIAADHIGEENATADLLQALDEKRDYQFSLRNLRLLMAGDSLDATAKVLLDKRLAQRAAAKELVDKKAFHLQNGVAWIELESAIDDAFFSALLPDAMVILLFSPRPREARKWNVKARLGIAAHPGLSVEQLIKPIDGNFGGRWNAGSNKRGGSSVPPQEYAEAIVARLTKSEK